MNHAVPACLRRALVWLMLLAIPFQGVAWAAMAACTHANAAQSVSAALALAPATAAPAGHCPAAGAPAAHGPDHPVPLEPEAPEAQQTQQAHPPHDHEDRCSACAACCIGAAMAATPTIAAPPTLSTRLNTAASGRLEAVDLALPERPPRFSPA